MRDVTLDLRIVTDIHDPLLIVDLGGLGFVEADPTNLLPENVTDGFHNRAVLDQTGGTRRQKGCKEEVIPGRDNNDIVVFRIELLQEGNSTPTSTYAIYCISKLYTALLVAMTQTRTENNKRFPRRIRLDLVNWVARIVDTVRHGPYERNSAHPGETPGPSQETE